MTRALTVLIALIVQSTWLYAAVQEQTEPLKTDLTEEVEVRFVILDALVTDSRGSIVTDLSQEEFELYLDLKPHAVASVDLFCSEGAAAEPKAVWMDEQRPAAEIPETQQAARRIALVIDYKNMPQTRRVEVVDKLIEAVRNNHAPNDELMLVAITRRLRVEQPFTTDPEKIVTALERMKSDPSLWQEYHYVHFEEFELFDGLIALIRMLASYEGNKAVILYSDLPSKIEDAPFRRFLLATPAAFDYDTKFEDVATSATDARVAIYPIHSSGLTLRRASDRLARLAVETGGRFSRYTNDLSLPYARAQRDLGCRYAVGFYDTNPEQDRTRRVNLKVRRPGLRVAHPVLYRFGSDEVARASLADTVYTAPSAFRGDAVRGGFFPVRPTAKAKRWEGAVVVQFRVTVPEGGTAAVKFGAKIDDASRRAVHAFDSEVSLKSEGHVAEQLVVVVEPVTLAPGSYELSIVVNDFGAEGPRAAVLPLELPPLPRRELLVVDPILGRPAAKNVILSWSDGFAPLSRGGNEKALQPVLPDESVPPGPLTAVTRVCLPRSVNDPIRVEVDRSIVGNGGTTYSKTDSLVLDSISEDGDRCRQVFDDLPAEEMQPGIYEFRVTVGTGDEPGSIVKTRRFIIESETTPGKVEPNDASP